MENHKIVKFYSSTKNKKGEEYRTKEGKLYTRVAVQTDLLPQGTWASANAFNPDDPILRLKEGDKVILKVWQNGDWWNFKMPSRLDLLEERVIELESTVFGAGKTENKSTGKEEESDIPF